MSEQGWICPICRKVYSPYVRECEACNGAKVAPVEPYRPCPPITPWPTTPEFPFPWYPGWPGYYTGDPPYPYGHTICGGGSIQ